MKASGRPGGLKSTLECAATAAKSQHAIPSKEWMSSLTCMTSDCNPVTFEPADKMQTGITWKEHTVVVVAAGDFVKLSTPRRRRINGLFAVS